jgi:hypothetical protein
LTMSARTRSSTASFMPNTRTPLLTHLVRRDQGDERADG